MSLKNSTLSTICQRDEAKGAMLTLRERTENPRRVHRSWYISNRRKPPASLEEDTEEDGGTSRKCSELIQHV